MENELFKSQKKKKKENWLKEILEGGSQEAPRKQTLQHAVLATQTRSQAENISKETDIGLSIKPFHVDGEKKGAEKIFSLTEAIKNIVITKIAV